MSLSSEQFDAHLKRSVHLKHLMYTPESSPPAEGYPLILSLHGAGQRGDNLDLLEDHGLLKYVNATPDFPYLVCTPQCPESDSWILYLDDLLLLLDEIVEKYPVDPRRVILMGLSMGANGTWLLACKAPQKFAAVVPVCGWGDWLLDFPDRVSAMKSVPVWAFHGEEDDVIPVEESRKMIDALNACGGEAELTTYPDIAHESWDLAFAEKKLYTWLRSKRSNA